MHYGSLQYQSVCTMNYANFEESDISNNVRVYSKMLCPIFLIKIIM